jgi:hypothetical protein
MSNLSWPEVDEDRQVVDLERSKTRNSAKDQAHLTTESRQHEQDRSVSGESARSRDSIHAIIRDRPQSGTPPLRRADRSVSSDLRAASRNSSTSDASLKLDKAAKDAKAQKAGSTRSLHLVDTVVASSSTYDPVKDKGKGRITKMTDVYVSALPIFHL